MKWYNFEEIIPESEHTENDGIFNYCAEYAEDANHNVPGKCWILETNCCNAIFGNMKKKSIDNFFLKFWWYCCLAVAITLSSLIAPDCQRPDTNLVRNTICFVLGNFELDWKCMKQ